MWTEKYKTIYKLIESFDTIVIARHVGVDPDAMSSQLALRDSILKTFPNKTVLAVGSGSVKFTYLGKLDKLKDDIHDALLFVLDTPDQKRVDGISNFDVFAKKVKMDQFISLHGGLDYKINDKVSNISLGEKQRLIIACYLANDYDFYIFDEATSNIDVESENDIMREIHELAKSKTVLLVSHRLANVVGADNIYVLDHGTVAESGSHEEMLSRHGLYERLWNAQQTLEQYGKEAVS